MIESSAANIAEHFADFLSKVQNGETVRIHENGRPVARLVPDTGFMTGSAAFAVFEGMSPDPEAALAVSREIKKLRSEADNALDHRH